MKRVGMLVLIVAALGVSGCANPNYTVINTATNEVFYCAASGYGWLGAPLAAKSAGDCVRAYEARGFMKLTTPANLEITTDPFHATVFSFPEPDVLVTEMGVAPINRTMPIGSYWKQECYKAVYDGRESDTVCRNVELNRRVHLVVKAKQPDQP